MSLMHDTILITIQALKSSSARIPFQYISIHAQYMSIHTKYMPIPISRRKPVCSLCCTEIVTCQCMPNTCQYMLIHTTIHKKYIPILDRCSTRFSPRGYIWECIMVCICEAFARIVMYSKQIHDNTYQYFEYVLQQYWYVL